MKGLAWYNGKTAPVEEMMIPMCDRSTFFGDGVYDATAVANGVPFALKEHIDRFWASFSALRIPFAMSKAELEELLLRLCRQVEGPCQILYWQTTRGSAPRSHAFPPSSVPANLLCTISPFSMAPHTKRLRLITTEDTRYLHCNIKTLNLLPNVMAAQKAAEAGCDETVFHRGDTVTECAHSNIMILQNGALRTMPLCNLILPGITRGHLLGIARQNGIPVVEEAFTVADMMQADEVIVTSSGALCCAADEIDGKPVGGRAPALLATLQQAYNARFLQETGFAL